MKCPKCGYHSFEALDNCKKCSHDLKDHKAKFHLRGLTLPGTALTAETAETATPSVAGETEKVAAVDSADNESIDFGFDFLEEEDQAGGATKDIPLGEDDDDKPAKGPEFAF